MRKEDKLKQYKLKQYQYPITKIRCSFCNKAQKQVEHLISGPNGVYICNECVNICNDIINEHDNLAEELEYIDRVQNIINECVKASDIRYILKAADYNIDKIKQAYAMYNRQSIKAENFIGWMISAIKMAEK